MQLGFPPIITNLFPTFQNWANGVYEALKSISGLGYTIQVAAGILATPLDNTTYYWGGFPSFAPQTVVNAFILVPKAGTLTCAKILWAAAGVAGSNENIMVYVRVNDTTDYLVATVGDTIAYKAFSNTAMAVPLVLGDYVEIKMVCPTWATNPANVYLSGILYIE